MTTILIADDDIELCTVLSVILKEGGYSIDVVHSGEDALESISNNLYDLILLDVMLPGIDGYQTAKRICQRFATPILMLTALGDNESKLKGYDAGADHFISKPFEVSELLARIRSILRRVSFERSRAKPLNEHQTVLQDTLAKMPLTQTERAILLSLVQAKGDAVTKRDLQTMVVGRELGEHDRNLDMHISKIRRKLSLSGLDRGLIKTVRGVGYAFSDA